jgi:hypothetical protein
VTDKNARITRASTWSGWTEIFANDTALMDWIKQQEHPIIVAYRDRELTIYDDYVE